RGGAEHDVDLTTGGIWIVAARHAEHAALACAGVELGLQRVAVPTAADAGVVERQRLRLRVAELDDEAALDAMHALPVVEALLRQGQEVLDVPGRILRKELEHDLAALLERHHGAGCPDRRLVLGPRRAHPERDGADDEQSAKHGERSEQSADY